MSFIVEDNGGGFEACPTGVHLSRCYRIIDLGTQKTTYMGQEKFAHKIMLCWEIHGTDEDGKPLLMRDGRNFAMFKNYTLSWSEKANLRIDLQSWRGKPFSPEEMKKFDLQNVLGAWCMLNLIETDGANGKTYVNIKGITPVPSIIKSSGFPAPVNKNEIFTMSNPNMEVFSTFSDNLKAKIKSSPEWKKIESPEDVPANYGDIANSDIPF